MKTGKVISGILGILSAATQYSNGQSSEKPNIILIYADDLGYGDLSCYGANSVKTPNIDRLASQGLRFTNANCTPATSTPSGYSLVTDDYAWRKKGTGVLPGEGAGPDSFNSMDVLQNHLKGIGADLVLNNLL